ncbi:uncharacterized protein LOC114244811, partial [Bombyx mandarina]|uniref:Uncharacterized protein LOC114244811 n=1 Tax=Bombyx mandarina TaxID=7092 RepID=A0A6J2JWF7_BOMMA
YKKHVIVSPRHVPRYSDLDEEDQHLFRAAYDTPSYDHEEQEDNEISLDKLDLLKGGLWAVKAKLKELKAFNKALAANMLSTKLKLKELLKNHMVPVKTIKDVDKKKTYYHYQPTPSHPQYEQYAGPQYGAPQHGYDPYYGH